MNNENIQEGNMNNKQFSVLGIATICTSLCHLLLSFWNDNFFYFPNFFYIIDLDIVTLSCSAVSWLSLTLLLKFFVVNLNKEDELAFSKLLQEFASNYLLVGFSVLFCLLQIILLVDLSLELFLRCLLVTIYYSIFFVSILMVMGYDEVDLAKSQDDQCSIGAYWATGATQAYYEKCLEKFKDRLKKFEDDKPGVTFFVKKLVLIAPLSCDIEGSLKDKDDKIAYVGDLDRIECDQGANMNRHLLNSVYKISNNEQEIFIAAEFPSPLGTLSNKKQKFPMDEKVKIYIRDCFLKELKDQLKSCDVIILEYDDNDPSTTVPLNKFIVSSLQNYVRENNVYL